MEPSLLSSILDGIERGGPATEEEVCIITLDDVVGEEGSGGGGGDGDGAFAELRTALRAATLLKMDLQGHEGLAVRGMSRILSPESRIRSAWVEITPAICALKGVDPLEVFQTFRAAGFQFTHYASEALFSERIAAVGDNTDSFIDLDATREVPSGVLEGPPTQ